MTTASNLWIEDLGDFYNFYGTMVDSSYISLLSSFLLLWLSYYTMIYSETFRLNIHEIA